MQLGDVLDAGSGDGTIAQLLAPRARSVTCLDLNKKMALAAGARLASQKNVTVRQGDVHDLPFPDAAFDHVLLFNVLTQAHTPSRAVVEAARVLRPGGNVSVITLDAHDHADVAAAYRDVHAGFSLAQIRKMLQKACLAVDLCEITCREKRPPHFQVVTAFAQKRAK